MATICVQNVYDVCVWYNGNPVYCATGQICLNGTCSTVPFFSPMTVQDQSMYTCTGTNKFYYKGTCYSLADCPICPRNSYCSLSVGASLVFTCVAQTAIVCSRTTFLQATFDWTTSTTTPTLCKPGPQWSHTYNAVVCGALCTACSPVCNSTQFCVQGVCVPSVSGICYWANSNTPVFCNKTQTCVDNVCRNTHSFAGNVIVDCGAQGGVSVCINNVITLTKMCPVCPPSQYCMGVKQEDGKFLYMCSWGAVSPVCAACTPMQWCHATYNFLTNTTVPAQLPELPPIQLHL